MSNDKEKWILCRSCGTKLCKEKSPGVYEFRKSHGKRVKYCIKLIAGEITCWRCEALCAIPPFQILEAAKAPIQKVGKNVNASV